MGCGVTRPGTVLDAADGPLADEPHRLLGLPAGAIQETLDRLATSKHAP